MHNSLVSILILILSLVLQNQNARCDESGKSIRIMTDNIHHCEGVDVQKISPTIPVSKPTRKIDYVFVQRDSSWLIDSPQVLVEPVASDHLPLVATLRWR